MLQGKSEQKSHCSAEESGSTKPQSKITPQLDAQGELLEKNIHTMSGGKPKFTLEFIFELTHEALQNLEPITKIIPHFIWMGVQKAVSKKMESKKLSKRAKQLVDQPKLVNVITNTLQKALFTLPSFPKTKAREIQLNKAN